MSFSQRSLSVFNRAIDDYHLTDNVDSPIANPFQEKTIDNYLYLKNWIDTVQWHLEDIIRDPGIDPSRALLIKRTIDKSNQERTDLVELIDSYFLERFSNVTLLNNASINTESPAWAIDRLSILALKIFHMKVESKREDSTQELREKCTAKLSVLQEQCSDLSLAIDTLLEDMAAGRKFMKVYRQMKMYNDPSLNPVLYGQDAPSK